MGKTVENVPLTPVIELGQETHNYIAQPFLHNGEFYGPFAARCDSLEVLPFKQVHAPLASP